MGIDLVIPLVCVSKHRSIMAIVFVSGCQWEAFFLSKGFFKIKKKINRLKYKASSIWILR